MPSIASRFTIRPRTVARSVTIALWAVGSAYLLKSELALPEPDPVVMASTPVVWAVIISLPILATYARRDGLWVATMLIWLAAIVGSAYTLNATIGRQATARDTAVAGAEEIVRQRQVVAADLATTRRQLEAARQRCGTGKVCHDSTKQLIGMYEREADAHQAKLDTLKPATPTSGEHRVAALIAILTGSDLAATSELVGLVSPCLFGLMLELSAFAAAMYGWHPPGNDCRQRLPEHLPLFLPAPMPENVAANVGKHPVIAALEAAGRPVNNAELAKLMSVCDGEATKRRREVAGHIVERRVGRQCQIALRRDDCG